MLLTMRNLMTGFRTAKCLVVTRPPPMEQSQYCSSLRPLENCLTTHTAIQHFTPASGNCFRKWGGHDVTVRKELDRAVKQSRYKWEKWNENRRKNLDGRRVIWNFAKCCCMLFAGGASQRSRRHRSSLRPTERQNAPTGDSSSRLATSKFLY